MSPTQKLINDGNAVVDEMLAGVLAAHPGHLRPIEGAPRVVVAKDGPRPGKVALVIGGGSGHEPTFLGYVGKGLADAAVIGNVFASPPPQPDRRLRRSPPPAVPACCSCTATMPAT